MKKLKVFLGSLLIIIVLAGIVCWVAFVVKNQEVKNMNAAARVNAGGQFIQLTDGITHYQKAGVDTGKTVILVHGFSVTYYIWNGTYQPCAAGV